MALRSIVKLIGNQNFPRIRVGIGPLPPSWELVSYVLADIPKDQQTVFFEALGKAADAVELTLREGLEAAMNETNQAIQPIQPKPKKPAKPASPAKTASPAEPAEDASQTKDNDAAI